MQKTLVGFSSIKILGLIILALTGVLVVGLYLAWTVINVMFIKLASKITQSVRNCTASYS